MAQEPLRPKPKDDPHDSNAPEVLRNAFLHLVELVISHAEGVKVL